MSRTNDEKMESIIRHIKMVENNCNIISKKTMDTSPNFAILIAKRGRLHDASKFDELEFDHLWEGDELFDMALLHHRSNNSHHPEFYPNGIFGMSNVDIAEYVADCCARGQEFGTDVRDWLLVRAAEKYGYKDEKLIMQEIEMYINMILNKPFIQRKLDV